MIISENMKKQLVNFNHQLENILNNNSLTDAQISSFLINFERIRYNILNEIKEYNKYVEYEHEKIKTIDNNYSITQNNGILKIYVPEVMPSFKNLKTHTYKRILLNVAEISREFKNTFSNRVFIYIKIYDNVQGWDIDNKYVKPIADALIMSGVIQDDNVSKMFYCVKGEFSENPHTEIYVLDSEKIEQSLKKIEYKE